MLMSAILKELEKRAQTSPEPATLGKDFHRPPDPQCSGRAGLVITGKTLEFALQESVQRQFLELTSRCQAVVCCRATPLQKSEVVKLVRNHLHVMTLAIGEWRWEGGHPARHSPLCDDAQRGSLRRPCSVLDNVSSTWHKLVLFGKRILR